MLAAVRRTCGAEGELGKGENRSKTTCPNSKDEDKNHHRHMYTNVNLDEYESERRRNAEASPAKCTMNAPVHAVACHSTMLLCALHSDSLDTLLYARFDHSEPRVL